MRDRVWSLLEYGGLVELADTRDLKSLAIMRTGPSPVSATNKEVLIYVIKNL